MNREQLMEQLYGLSLIAHDIHLYLDVNPNDEKAIADYKRITDEYQLVLPDFEREFGPLTFQSHVENVSKKYITEPWPWHNKGGK